MNNLIAVTAGDIDGIGLKVLTKEWNQKKISDFILISNVKIFKALNILFKYG